MLNAPLAAHRRIAACGDGGGAGQVAGEAAGRGDRVPCVEPPLLKVAARALGASGTGTVRQSAQCQSASPSSAVQCSRRAAPRCTALHCTALHCTALHTTALHCEQERARTHFVLDGSTARRRRAGQPLSFALNHTHAHTHTHTLALALTLARMRAHAHTCTHAHACTRTHAVR